MYPVHFIKRKGDKQMKLNKALWMVVLLLSAVTISIQGTSSTVLASKTEVKDELDTSKWDEVQIGEAIFQVPEELTGNDLLSGLMSWTLDIDSMMNEENKGTLSKESFLLHNIKIYQPSDKDYPLTSAFIASFTCDELLQYIKDSKEAGVEPQLTSEDVSKTFETLKGKDFPKKKSGEFPYIRKVGSESISEFMDDIGLSGNLGKDSVLYIGIKELDGVDHMIYGVFHYESDEYGKSLVYSDKIMNTITFNN